MFRYTARRLAFTVPLLLIVSFLAFLMTRLLPGDPARLLAGPYASNALVTQIRESLGLDKPIPSQYWHYLIGLLHGNLGVSIRTHSSVAQQLIGRLPATAELALAAMVIAVALGVPLGALAGRKPDGRLDRLSLVTSVAGMSIPQFWLGLMLLVYLAGSLGLFPIGGRSGVNSVILPALTLALQPAALIARLTRSVVITVLSRDYVRTARAKGASEWRVMTHHVMRNAIPPTVTVVALQFGTLLGGVIIIETIYGWPGIGSLLILAINSRDYPVVQGIILLIAVVFVLVNLAADLFNAYLDPRLAGDR